MGNEPKRVLQVLGRLDRGGAESMVMNYYRNIDRSKIQFDFLLHTADECDFSNEVLTLGGNIFSIPRLRLFNYFQYRRSLHIFFKKNGFRYSIVHGHMGRNAAIYLSIAKKYGIFTIAHSHGTKNTPDIRGLLYKIMAFPTRFVANYFFGCSLEAGKARYGNRVVNSKHFMVVNNAIDVQSFRYDKTIREDVLQKLNWEHTFVIGHVGRLIAVKNHLFLLELLKLMLTVEPRSHLLIVGDGEERKKIEDRAKELGVTENIHITGITADVSRYLNAMDVFVFPSWYEGLPLVLVEAQSSGLPCIVSDRVSKETKFSEDVHYLPLEVDPMKWVEAIMEYIDIKTRYEEVPRAIIEAGYDIRQASKFLENFYLEKTL